MQPLLKAIRLVQPVRSPNKAESSTGVAAQMIVLIPNKALKINSLCCGSLTMRRIRRFSRGRGGGIACASSLGAESAITLIASRCLSDPVTASTFMIGDRPVGPDHPPMVIAEMSGNHNQSLDRAFELVDAAAEAGAHALKLQTYTADTITLRQRGGDFQINDEGSLWAGQNLHDLYTKAHTPWEWHQPIMERAASKGMLCFSSPFDETAVDFLDDLNVPAFKIASFENNHLPLIRKAASTGKPLIISTGMASLADLERAVTTAREAGCENLILLKCTSTYPATPKNTNIRTITHLRDLFGVQVHI